MHLPLSPPRRRHLKANSTRPALLFTNNGNVKLTARPAIDTSAGRDSLFLLVENFPRRLFFPPLFVPPPPLAVAPYPVPPALCSSLLAVSRTFHDSFCFLVSCSHSPTFFHAVHRNALGVRCTFVAALLSQVRLSFADGRGNK